MKSSDLRSPGSPRTGEPKPESLSAIAETVARYDRIAARFAVEWGDLRLERALAAFDRRVTGQRRVLDLGCGPGRDVEFLMELGCRVVGLDLSVGMLAEGRRRLPDAPFIRADLRLLPFASSSLDGVWACASLLHLPHAQLPAALAEIARVLQRPGGVLYLAVKGGQGERWCTDQDGRRQFFAFYHPPDIETALRQAGFQILETWVAPDAAGRSESWITVIARH